MFPSYKIIYCCSEEKTKSIFLQNYLSGLDRALGNTSQGDLLIDPCCCCISFELHSTFPNQLYTDLKVKFMIKIEKPTVLEFHWFE